MDDTKRSAADVLAEHGEDLALASGALMLGAGVGMQFGVAFGLMAVGALLVAYGVWITTGRRQ